MSAVRLGCINAVWVLLLTANSRIINAHFTSSLIAVVLSQVAVSFGYFSLVKAIQKATNFSDKAAYCIGGAVGAIGGIFVTRWAQ